MGKAPMEIAEEFFAKGVKVITYPAKRDMPKAKTLNYINAVRALRKAKREDAEDCLKVLAGRLDVSAAQIEEREE